MQSTALSQHPSQNGRFLPRPQPPWKVEELRFFVFIIIFLIVFTITVLSILIGTVPTVLPVSVVHTLISTFLTVQTIFLISVLPILIRTVIIAFTITVFPIFFRTIITFLSIIFLYVLVLQPHFHDGVQKAIDAMARLCTRDHRDVQALHLQNVLQCVARESAPLILIGQHCLARFAHFRVTVQRHPLIHLVIIALHDATHVNFTVVLTGR